MLEGIKTEFKLGMRRLDDPETLCVSAQNPNLHPWAREAFTREAKRLTLVEGGFVSSTMLNYMMEIEGVTLARAAVRVERGRDDVRVAHAGDDEVVVLDHDHGEAARVDIIRHGALQVPGLVAVRGSVHVVDLLVVDEVEQAVAVHGTLSHGTVNRDIVCLLVRNPRSIRRVGGAGSSSDVDPEQTYAVALSFTVYAKERSSVGAARQAGEAIVPSRVTVEGDGGVLVRGGTVHLELVVIVPTVEDLLRVENLLRAIAHRDGSGDPHHC